MQKMCDALELYASGVAGWILENFDGPVPRSLTLLEEDFGAAAQGRGEDWGRRERGSKLACGEQAGHTGHTDFTDFISE